MNNPVLVLDLDKEAIPLNFIVRYTNTYQFSIQFCTDEEGTPFDFSSYSIFYAARLKEKDDNNIFELTIGNGLSEKNGIITFNFASEITSTKYADLQHELFLTKSGEHITLAWGKLITVQNRSGLNYYSADPNTYNVDFLQQSGLKAIIYPRALTLGNSIIQYPAGIDISGHKVVIVNNGVIVYADKDNNNHAGLILGITLNASLEGELVDVQTYNIVTESSWSWDVTKKIYLGNNGNLIQEPPTSGFLQKLAFPLSPTRIFIDIKEPIIL